MSAVPFALADTETLYIGTCRNVSFGADGLLKLYIIETDKGLDGYVSKSGFLVGGGALKGTREGNQFKFRTSDPLWGVTIDWQGTLRGTTLSGEYFCAPNPKMKTPKQVGEWQVEEFTPQWSDRTPEEIAFYKRFVVWAEMDLNNPLKLANGSTVTGAQALFQSVHPAGTGVSVQVTDARIEWKEGVAHTDFKNIHRYALDYVLYWKGVVTATGRTRLRLTYNVELNAITSNEILETTGITKQDVGEMTFDIGFLLGRAAMESLTNSK